jgi:hypothetical protein
MCSVQRQRISEQTKECVEIKLALHKAANEQRKNTVPYDLLVTKKHRITREKSFANQMLEDHT